MKIKCDFRRALFLQASEANRNHPKANPTEIWDPRELFSSH